ncbi:MAG TPA: DNRLRE domain-containing protein [Terriglobales bacterium]
MKNLYTQLAALLLSTLCLLPGAFGQLTPSGDSYTNTAASTTNYGAKTLLDVESSQTTFIQFDLSSIPTGYTSADITKATLKLYVNAVTTAGSFNVDYVNGAWTESTIDASNAPALGTNQK